MKRKSLIIFIPLILMGCAQSVPPSPPKPIGDLVPVNPTVIYISDLKR